MARDELVAELKQMRRGLGVHEPDLLARLGPQLRRVCGIGDGDDIGEARQKLTDQLATAIATLPEDVRMVLAAALALDPAPGNRFLESRIRWLADRIDRNPRTVMRRADQGFALLAESLLLDGPAVEQDPASPYAPPGWYVRRLRSILHLTGDPVTLFEERTIVCTVSRLDVLTATWSFPGPAGSLPRHPLHAEMIFGGTLVQSITLSTSTIWAGELRLPRPLHRGEAHSFGVRVTALDRRDFRPYFVLSPHRRVDEFELRLRFDPLPSRVWRLAGVPYRIVDDLPPGTPEVSPDTAGEVEFRTVHPREGLSYGLRWQY